MRKQKHQNEVEGVGGGVLGAESNFANVVVRQGGQAAGCWSGAPFSVGHIEWRRCTVIPLDHCGNRSKRGSISATPLVLHRRIRLNIIRLTPCTWKGVIKMQLGRHLVVLS